MKVITNAILVTSVWLIPVIFLSCLLDQLMPKVKKDEKKSFTLLMTIVQVVLSFLLFEGIERTMGSFNKGFLSHIKMPELVNGAILLGLIQSKTQRTLGERVGIIYDTIDKGLENINIGV